MVTATTVGYGDMYPTTPAGKAIAGVSMVWSLCVLALPIGVIGNNFSTVWEEYDEEKKKFQWNMMKEEMMLKRSSAWGDPLQYSKRILLEVWHDPGIGEDDAGGAEFMGEVDITLDMPEQEEVTGKMTVPLASNFDKARRRVRGQITFEYRWTPSLDHPKTGVSPVIAVHNVDKKDDDSISEPDYSLLTGKLEVTVLSGDELIAIDWKGSCSSDPYVVVIAYPNSPAADGHVEPLWYRSDTAENTSSPQWKFKAEFEVDWTKVGTQSCIAADMRQLGNGVENSPIAQAPARKSIIGLQVQEPTESEKKEMLQKQVPELQEELDNLKYLVVPQISAQISDVQQDLELILQALRSKRGIQKPSNVDSRLPAQANRNDPMSVTINTLPERTTASPWTTTTPFDSDVNI